MMVVVLNNLLHMDSAEKRALTVLNRLEMRSELRHNAGVLLASFASLKMHMRNSTRKNIIIP
jgi:hypothetical protein